MGSLGVCVLAAGYGGCLRWGNLHVQRTRLSKLKESFIGPDVFMVQIVSKPPSEDSVMPYSAENACSDHSLAAVKQVSVQSSARGHRATQSKED